MVIRHPYNFVPFGAVERAERGAGHDRYRAELYSGRFECTLTTKSLLCIKDHFLELKGPNEEKSKAPYIRGSSLKGMLRTMVQMMGAGCGRGFPDTKRDPFLAETEVLKPCEGEAICVACRLFGFTGGDQQNAWAAKTRIEDTEPAADWSFQRWTPIPTGKVRWQSPEGLRKAFYYKNGAPAGWKIYRHGQAADGAGGEFQSDACVKKGERFAFQLHYENLNEEELAILRFALTLRYECAAHGWSFQLWHKLGYGKGIGLGSCEITATEKAMESRRYFGDETLLERAPQCEEKLERYLALPSFQKLGSFLSPDRAGDTLKFPGGWLLKNPNGSIDSFESSCNGRIVPCEPAPKPTTPKPTTPKPTMPRTLRGSVRKDRGGVTATTPWNGKVYTCKTKKLPLWHVKDGMDCEIDVAEVIEAENRIVGTIRLLYE